MTDKTPRPADWPASMLDDDRTWQGDYDPYLGALARQGRRPFYAARPAEPGAAWAEPAGDDADDDSVQHGDPYLAGLRRMPPDDSAAR